MSKTLLFLAGLVFFLSASASAWAQTPCQAPPGNPRPAHNWRLLTPYGSPARVSYEDVTTEDQIVVSIQDGAAAGLRDDQIKIILTTDSWVTWRKEVSAWSCSGKTQTISTDGADHGPHEMTIDRGAGSSRIDTIVLTKAKFLGWMWDMYHFDPAYFWQVYGGKIVTIDWFVDNLSYPEYS